MLYCLLNEAFWSLSFLRARLAKVGGLLELGQQAPGSIFFFLHLV